MKYLCLAYGDEADWNALSKDEQDALLAQDDMLRRRGDLVAVVGSATTVRAWDGNTTTNDDPFATAAAPLVGFSLIEADDLEQAIRLVEGTPCARAKGAIEVRPVRDLGQ